MALFVTKHLAELCSLFIDDVYGELPSRIFSALVTRGRSTLNQLVQYTALSPRQLRHGLAVLIQHNMLYYSIGGSPTVYEANVDVAYNLMRSGKILELIGSLHGEAGKDVVQSLMVLGNTKIGDLKEAYAARLAKHQEISHSANHNGTSKGVNGYSDPFASDDDSDAGLPTSKESQPVESVEHLNSVLCHLVEDELLIVVTGRMFQSFDDVYSDVQREMETKHWPQGVRGTKEKERYQQKVSERLREIRDQATSLKRKLGENPVSSKRRKVGNGDVANGVNDSYNSPPLDPDVVLRINYEKCLIELRNRRLAGFVSETVGETTGQVYAVILQLLTKKIARCRAHPIIDAFQDNDDESVAVRDYVTTDEVFDNLSPSLDVGTGIGRANPDLLDFHGVERIRRFPPKQKEPYIEENDDHSDDETEGLNGDGPIHEYDDELYNHPSDQGGEIPAQNGGRETKVKFKEQQKGESRLAQMRQHLLLLCENTQGFLRHRGNGQWTVDFGPLVRRVQETELDTVMERKIGRHSLRLVRILRKRGRLDEKALQNMAMMAKGTVHKMMLEMQMHGFVDVQEVPKDNSRNAKTTLFLWFADTDRALAQLLDNTYKSMLRILQVREVHRLNAREVLRFVEHRDVKGREKETLEKKYYERYEQYRAIEDKILGHVMRLDDLVAVLKDF